MKTAHAILRLANRSQFGEARQRAWLLGWSSFPGLQTIHVAGWRRDFALRLEQPGLQVDDVVAQLVVFRLHRLEVFAQDLIVSHLLFELLDIALFPLPKRSLEEGSQ